MLQTHRCPLCGSDRRRQIDAEDGIGLMACGPCGHWYADRGRYGNELEAFYRETGGYDSPGQRSAPAGTPGAYGGAEFRALSRLHALRKADLIEQYVPTGALLEIGCSDGVVLRELAARGRDVFGCELQRDNLRRLREWLPPERVFDCTIPEIPSGLRFAGIALFHVLALLADPVGDLAILRELLLPGGFLIVVVPNGEFQRLRRVRAVQTYSLDTHHHVFRIRRLVQLFAASGFAVAGVHQWARITPSWERPGVLSRVAKGLRGVLSRVAPRWFSLMDELVVAGRRG